MLSDEMSTQQVATPVLLVALVTRISWRLVQMFRSVVSLVGLKCARHILALVDFALEFDLADVVLLHVRLEIGLRLAPVGAALLRTGKWLRVRVSIEDVTYDNASFLATEAANIALKLVDVNSCVLLEQFVGGKFFVAVAACEVAL